MQKLLPAWIHKSVQDLLSRQDLFQTFTSTLYHIKSNFLFQRRLLIVKVVINQLFLSEEALFYSLSSSSPSLLNTHDHLHHHHLSGDPHLCAQAAWSLSGEYFCWVPTTCLSWWLWWWPDYVMMILILILMMIIFPQPVSSDDDVIDECESGWVEECESSIQRRGLGEEIFWGWSCQ